MPIRRLTEDELLALLRQIETGQEPTVSAEDLLCMITEILNLREKALLRVMAQSQEKV
jgi:hypothetical protein